MRAAIWQVDRDQAVGNAVGLEEYIGRTLRPRLLLTGVMSLFAVTTLLLAACGVYGGGGVAGSWVGAPGGGGGSTAAEAPAAFLAQSGHSS